MRKRLLALLCALALVVVFATAAGALVFHSGNYPLAAPQYGTQLHEFGYNPAPSSTYRYVIGATYADRATYPTQWSAANPFPNNQVAVYVTLWVSAHNTYGSTTTGPEPDMICGQANGGNPDGSQSASRTVAFSDDVLQAAGCAKCGAHGNNDYSVSAEIKSGFRHGAWVYADYYTPWLSCADAP